MYFLSRYYVWGVCIWGGGGDGVKCWVDFFLDTFFGFKGGVFGVGSRINGFVSEVGASPCPMTRFMEVPI